MLLDSPISISYRSLPSIKLYTDPIRSGHGGRDHWFLTLVLLAWGWPAGAAFSADWPTHLHDNRRSGFTTEQLETGALAVAWHWTSPHPPQPAWSGPARWDAFARRHNLPAMRNYDPVFHVTAAAGRVYFGSSVDDSVRCLDANNGEVLWTFTTGGPVRVAPTIAHDHVYFGSDDGFAYCVHAETGQESWRFSPADTSELLLNNGRFIAPHPCRTGVMVEGDTAYFGCALLPWQKAWLCAVDAGKGQPIGPGRFVQPLDGNTLEAPPAASSKLLIFPQGRVAPLVFRRSDGKNLGPLKKSGGGSVVVVSLDARIIHGPGAEPREGAFKTTAAEANSDGKTLEMVASHGRGNALVVVGGRSFMLTDNELIASELATRDPLWRVPCDLSLALIAAGETLVAGGVDRVGAFSIDSGQPLWSAPVEGKVFGLAVANGQLLVSTDAGHIYAFRPGTTQLPNTTTDPAAKQPRATPVVDNAWQPLAGPSFQFDRPGEAIVRWHTQTTTPSQLDYHHDDLVLSISDAQPTTQHQLRLSGLKHNRIYSVTLIDNQEQTARRSAAYELDTFFDFSPQPILSPRTISAEIESPPRMSTAARTILQQSHIDRGLCLVYGLDDGSLAVELARQSRLKVIAIDTDHARVDSIRRRLIAAGSYGHRLSVYHVPSFSQLPLPGHWANLVVSESLVRDGTPILTAAEAHRQLRPDGGVACLGQPAGTAPQLAKKELADWLGARADSARIVVGGELGTLAIWTRGPLQGAGEWSHLYGRADNSAFGGEQLLGVTKASDLAVQWVGRPGPRYQVDRNGRKPSPLSTAGRLFLQGLHRLAAVDAFNGSILWTLEIPDLQRFNMPRDSGNWCADRDFLYVAVRDRLWKIDVREGRVTRKLEVPSPQTRQGPWDWGYIARSGDKIIGTSVRRATSWTNFWGGGGEGWYEGLGGEVTHKICSDALFSIDRDTDKVVWNYQNGVVLNSTITISDGKVYFIECRHETVIGAPERRVGRPELWKQQFLVAVDANDGSLLWEQPIELPPGKIVFYMAHGKGRLVVVGSADGKYHIHTFASANGKPDWSRSFGWPDGKGDHGKAMSRPAIVDDKLYVRPLVLNIKDGSDAEPQMPIGGCGTYACSTGAVFFRAETLTVWNPVLGQSTTWNRLRPDCWLSTIPAGGLLLSPEGGGGCSCGIWLETSVGFIPRQLRQPR